MDEQPETLATFWREGVSPDPPGPVTARLARLAAGLYLVGVESLERGLSWLRGAAREVPIDRPTRILALGPFYSANWVAAHLHALGRAPEQPAITVITPEAYAPLPGVRYLVPPAWLRRIVGHSIARALTALRLAVTEKPDVIVAYHAPFNGMAGLLIGRLARARTAYFSVGGPAEVIGGGLYSEHALFRRIGRESPRLERHLLRMLARFDSVLTMGSQSAAWFRGQGIKAPIWPMGASVDGSSFPQVETGSRSWDIVTVARLAPIKRLDLLLEAVSRLVPRFPGIRVAVVGDGSDRARLEGLCRDLSLTEQVTFTGFRSDVARFLGDSRMLVMTSASEGLPLAIVEAMLTGLPVIAPAIGDIPDLIHHGENGLLIPPGDAEACATAIGELLDTPNYDRMREAARRLALSYTVEGRVRQWSDWLAAQRGG